MKTVHICERPGCGQQFESIMEGRHHEWMRMPTKVAERGDIVRLGPRYLWVNGNPWWVANLNTVLAPSSREKFFDLYFVVTEVEELNHKWRYHLASKAIKSTVTAASFISGYLEANADHMVVVKEPPANTLESSKGFLGYRFDVPLLDGVSK